MYTGNNPSALRSRNEIVKAFFKILKNTPLEDISIKSIMDETDLSRQTFYQIFDSKEEILEYYLDDLFAKFISESKAYSICNLCAAAKVFFTFFGEHKGMLSLLVRNGKSCVVQRKCREFLKNDKYIHFELPYANNDSEREYVTTFIISGIVAMLEQWLRDDTSNLSTKELSVLVCRITRTCE